MRFFIDVSRVNIDDLLVQRPDAIIRCDGNPHDCVLAVNDNIADRAILSRGCDFCGFTTYWRVADPPPKKCESCGAPPR